MKTSVLLLGLAILLPMAANAQDDVYYIPSKDIRKVTTTDGTLVPTESTADKAQYYEETRDVDDYNRRSSVLTDTAEYYNEEATRIVESKFDDSSDDVAYPYTKLVMRFHSPHVGYIVSSPYYWDICYGDVWDVYYDGWAAYVPSYTYWSYTYDPWYYNRWHFRTCWDFTWGWYDRWYYRSYWGWGRPIYWGWSRPYYHHYAHHYSRPAWGHHYGRYVHGFGHHGGRTFAGRGMDRPRADFGGRIGGGRAGYATRSGGSRPLSGVFRSSRQPASHASTQMSRGTRRTGPNSVMRTDNISRNGGGISRNGGGGISRSGRVAPGNADRQRSSQVQRRPDVSRTPSGVSRSESRPSTRSSVPSSVGRSSSSSRPSGGFGGGGSIGRSSSPSHSGGGMSRGGGGGVSRSGGGVARGGRR